MQRRDVILGMGAAALGALAGPPARAQTPSAAPMLTDDGLYKEPWFVESFLDLPDDLEGARKENKRFVVMWSSRAARIARRRISSISRSRASPTSCARISRCC